MSVAGDMVGKEKYLPLCDRLGAVHPGSGIEREAMTMQRGGLVQEIQGMNQQRVVSRYVNGWRS